MRSMSRANAKDYARCTSRGCGSLKKSALSVWHGRWRPAGLRSAAIGQAAAAVGRHRGLMRGVRGRPGAAGRRPDGNGQAAWLQSRRESMPPAGGISVARWCCGPRIDSLFSVACRQVGGRYSSSYAVTWRHNSNRKMRADPFKSPVFSQLRVSTRAFCSSYAAKWRHSCCNAGEGTQLSSVISVVPGRPGNRCTTLFA
jgi:hypothetical protein